MNFPRASGVLLHPTSLPGPFGIGDLVHRPMHLPAFSTAVGRVSGKFCRWDQPVTAIHLTLVTRLSQEIRYSSALSNCSAADIVWTLALETKACCDLVDNGQVNWRPVPPPADPNAILAAFEKHSATLDDRLQRMNDAAWDKSAQLLINDKLVREASVGEFLWYIFSTLFITVDN